MSRHAFSWPAAAHNTTQTIRHPRTISRAGRRLTIVLLVAIFIRDPKDISSNADRSHGPEVGSWNPIVVLEVLYNSPAQPATHSALRARVSDCLLGDIRVCHLETFTNLQLISGQESEK